MQLNSTQHQILTINEIKLTQPPPLQNPKGEKNQEVERQQQLLLPNLCQVHTKVETL